MNLKTGGGGFRPLSPPPPLVYTIATSNYNKANCLNKQFYNNFNHSYPHYQLFLSKVTQTLWTVPVCSSALKMKLLN